MHKKKQAVPNAVVYLDLLSPNMGTKKFVAVLTDEATKITATVHLPDKSSKTLAWAIFIEWICKFSVRHVIDTNLGHD